MKRKLHKMMTGLRNKTVILVLGVLALTVAALVSQTYTSFLYFQF